MTLNPAIADALNSFVAAHLRKLRVVILGKVIQWHPEKQAADIEPLVFEVIRGEDDELTSFRPDVINLVPIATFALGGFTIQAAPIVGDVVTVLVSDREIETWLQGTGEATVPDSDRTHDLNDSIAIPWSPAPWVSPVSDIDSGDLIIGKADGSGELRVKADGLIIAGARGAATKGVARKDDSVTVDSATDSKMVTFMAAVHAAFTSPPPPAPDAGAALRAAYIAGLAAAGGTPPSTITGKVSTASSSVEVE